MQHLHSQEAQDILAEWIDKVEDHEPNTFAISPFNMVHHPKDGMSFGFLSVFEGRTFMLEVNLIKKDDPNGLRLARNRKTATEESKREVIQFLQQIKDWAAYFPEMNYKNLSHTHLEPPKESKETEKEK